MISLILLKLFTFSQILQGVPKLSHATVYMHVPVYIIICRLFFNAWIKLIKSDIKDIHLYDFFLS